jgi:DNA-binding FrmR family transcriptional regulator
MAISLQAMAGTYIENVKNQVVAAESELKKYEEYVLQLKQHLQECQESLQNNSTPANPMQDVPDTVTTQKINLPNPFDTLTVNSENT